MLFDSVFIFSNFLGTNEVCSVDGFSVFGFTLFGLLPWLFILRSGVLQGRSIHKMNIKSRLWTAFSCQEKPFSSSSKSIAFRFLKENIDSAFLCFFVPVLASRPSHLLIISPTPCSIQVLQRLERPCGLLADLVVRLVHRVRSFLKNN